MTIYLGSKTPVAFQNLPLDTIKCIFQFLKKEERFPFQFVNKRFRNLKDLFAFKLKPEEAYEPGIKISSIRYLTWIKSLGYKLNLNVFERAGEIGHYETLKWLKINGCPWNKWAYYQALKQDDLENILWLRKNSGLLSARDYAAVDGDVDFLTWLKDKGCPWDEESCAAAADRGYVNTIQWLRVNGCPWDERCCAAASKQGNIELLKWLRANECPWNYDTTTTAAEADQLETLKWLIDNGCPWDPNTCFSVCPLSGLTLNWIIKNIFEDYDDTC